MTTGLTIIYNSFLYYCCLVILARYILNCALKKPILISSFLIFIPLAILASSSDAYLLSPVYIAFEAIQFLLLKLSFKAIKIRHLVLSYILLYCFNTTIVSLIVAFFPQLYNYIDVIVNTVISVLCVVLCLSKLRYWAQQMLAWTPKYIVLLSLFLLIVATLVSVMITYFQFFRFPNVWNQWIQRLVSFLLLAICLIVPVIFMISFSNTRLKTLTTEYEQQIHAQAEHYKNLAEANHEVRRFRHDFKNIRIAIESLLERGDYDEALKLIRQCNNALEHPGGFHSAFDTGNGIADALLTDKQEKALVNNTQITFRGVIPTDFLSPTDLCVILGNSLDNALEACQKLPAQDSKTISVSCNCSSGFLFLSITNPIAEKVIIRNNHIATTKENKTLHGFGLYSLHTIVKKYDGELQLSSTEDSFTVSIDLCVTANVR